MHVVSSSKHTLLAKLIDVQPVKPARFKGHASESLYVITKPQQYKEEINVILLLHSCYHWIH